MVEASAFPVAGICSQGGAGTVCRREATSVHEAEETSGGERAGPGNTTVAVGSCKVWYYRV